MKKKQPVTAFDIAARVNARTPHGRAQPLTGEDILRIVGDEKNESHPVYQAVIAEWNAAFPIKKPNAKRNL